MGFEERCAVRQGQFANLFFFTENGTLFAEIITLKCLLTPFISDK